jgi:glyceraldehyde 3-phosphate dehydrogenase
VAVNDIVPAENIVYLLKYDTVYGRYEKTVETDGENLTIAGKTFRYSQEKDPRASIIDLGMTWVVDGDLVKILSWYDNEWGFTNQMVRAVIQIAQVTETTNVRQ